MTRLDIDGSRLAWARAVLRRCALLPRAQLLHALERIIPFATEEAGYSYATTYVRGRQAFGQTIADFQGIQWEIAKCAVDIEASRLLTYRAAELVDEGGIDRESVPYLSMAKYAATELAVRASGLAVQLLGAAGYMKDSPTEQWYRDARQLTIVEGTSQVQLGLSGRGVLSEHLWWD